MNIAQMIQEGGPAVAAAVAALVDPAIQPDALHLAAVGLARQQADEIERLTAERDKAHQDGIRAACERDAMRSERDSLLEQLAAAQREVVDRLAEAAALQEDLRYVAHSGMGSCAKVHVAPAGWQLVPVEPTPEMLAAFRAGFTDQLRRRRHGAPKSGFQGSAEEAGLRAMLRAAPKGGE